MKRWMKAASAMLVLCMAFCLLGGVGAKADEEVEIRKITVEYEGDPVPYGESIDKSDFEVRVYYTNGDREYTTDFTISPDTMKSRRSERVTVTVEDPETGREHDGVVSVECAEPDLESIEAEYIGDDLIVGGEIDRDDVRVEAFYSDDTSEYVDDWSLESYRLEDGSNYITVYYKENGIRESSEITVYAFEGELSYISAYYEGGNVTVGGKIDTSKVKVTGIYTERGYGSVTQTLRGWYLDSYNIQEGNNTVTVIYKKDGKTYTDTITVRGSSSAVTTPTTPASGGMWVQSGSNWKVKLSNNSYLSNSWFHDPGNGKWYYMEADGNMGANKWASINGKWYFLNADGSMATGWKMVGGKWYFLNEIDGDMYTGWKYYKNHWYYLVPGSGEMATSRWIGNWYVDSQGIWTQTR